MSARAATRPVETEFTLWDLVWVVSSVADSDREVIATVAHMLESGALLDRSLSQEFVPASGSL